LRHVVAQFGTLSQTRHDEYARRMAACDRTVLLDAASEAIAQLERLRQSIEAAMSATQPTEAEPGSAEKIAVLARRFAGSRSLWIEGDKQSELPQAGGAD
jgi:hypothetical protein